MVGHTNIVYQATDNEVYMVKWEYSSKLASYRIWNRKIVV